MARVPTVVTSPRCSRFVEPVGEHARADVAQAAAQIAEALRPEEELADDEDRPALADDLGRARDRAELRILEIRHPHSIDERDY